MFALLAKREFATLVANFQEGLRFGLFASMKKRIALDVPRVAAHTA